MKQHLWKDNGACFDSDTNLFFDKYEDNENLRTSIDSLCRSCPVQKICFANGVSGKEWGVWGGIYLENGEISREFSRHRTKEQWGEMWKSLTMESK
jgi:hypothetical protein